MKPHEFYNGLKTRKNKKKLKGNNYNLRSKQLKDKLSITIRDWIEEKLSN